jgi:hypothetical protein
MNIFAQVVEPVVRATSIFDDPVLHLAIQGLMISIVGFLGVFFLYLTNVLRARNDQLVMKALSDKLDDNTKKTEKVQENVQKIETATNSMKDALIISTAQASLAEGKVQGRAEQKAETEAKNQEIK